MSGQNSNLKGLMEEHYFNSSAVVRIILLTVYLTNKQIIYGTDTMVYSMRHVTLFSENTIL